ncbi:MAG: DoxX family protein [Bacteroidota bacterium]
MTILKYILQTEISESTKNLSLLIFRVTISISLFNTHGLKKIIHFEDTLNNIPDPLGMGSELSTFFAIFANVFCPLLIVLGVLTRLAIIPILSITLIGFFVVHAADPWSVRDVPLMYSIVFSLFLILGPGKYSIDQSIINRLK